MPCEGCRRRKQWIMDHIPDMIASRLTMPGGATDFTWREICPLSAAKLDRVIHRWIGTPYANGQRTRGAGVDCVQLIAAIADDWSDAAGPTPVPRLAHDAAMHNGRIGFHTVKAIRAVYDCPAARDGTLEPGDIVVVRTERPSLRGIIGRGMNHMGHAMIMTPRQNVAVHAIAGGVCLTSIANLDILRIYRFAEKCLWK